MAKPSSSTLRWLRLGLLALPLLAGCASYTQQTIGLREAWSTANYPVAAQIAQDKAKSASSTDAVLWNLEAGATVRELGNIDGSLASFKEADRLFDYWDTQPEISISRESESLLVNPAVLPYRGTDYDRIMESTYQALNYIQMGKFDEARVEMNRALERQQLAVRKNAEQIEKAQNAAAASTGANGGYDVTRAQNDSVFQSQMKQTYGDLDAMHFYAPYVNPFATYLQGICLMARPQSSSDLESARVDIQRVHDMIGSNPYIEADLALAQKLANNSGMTPETTYVIFETGMAPDREETRISIPLFVVSRSVPYFGVAFPRLKFNGQYNHGLIVQSSGSAPLRTAILCDMDSVIAQEFRNEMPVIVVKTLISAGAKAAAQYGIHESARNNDVANVLTEIAGTLYQDATNHADLRTWVTLPKQFQFCRLATPADHKLQIISQSTGESHVVDLPTGTVTMVYVKSTSADDPLTVQTFTLR